MTRGQWLRSTAISVVCIAALSGCAPAVQKASAGLSTAQTVVQTNVDWSALLQAMQKSATATVYKLKSDVSLKNGNMHTDYSVYGTINLPDKASISVHENNFNISFYQQGKVAYADEQSSWTQTTPVDNFDAYKGYVQLLKQASEGKVQLNRLNRTYVVDEYCDVYQFTAPGGLAAAAQFLNPTNAPQGMDKPAANAPIQYTFYVGQTSGYIRDVQTASVNAVNHVGPVTTNTDTTFFDIDNPTIAQVQIPQTLVTQLESKQS